MRTFADTRRGMRLIAFVVAAAVAAAMLVALVPAGAGAAVVEFPTGTVPQDAVAGPDGNCLVVETGPNKIGRVTPEGVLRSTRRAHPAC